jgi:hypothetical protein
MTTVVCLLCKIAHFLGSLRITNETTTDVTGANSRTMFASARPCMHQWGYKARPAKLVLQSSSCKLHWVEGKTFASWGALNALG